jgi:hypothetical protein
MILPYLVSYYGFWTRGFSTTECLLYSFVSSLWFLIGLRVGCNIVLLFAECWHGIVIPVYLMVKDGIAEFAELMDAPQALSVRFQARPFQPIVQPRKPIRATSLSAPSKGTIARPDQPRARAWTVGSEFRLRDKPQEFRYRPLSKEKREIRLIRLLCRIPQSDILICEIVHASLNDTNKPSYHALSYCWDDVTTGRELNQSHGFILCNGTALEITQNLALALLRILSAGHTYVWADQISINQKDFTETDDQVGIMGDIYTNAVGVFMWIGEDNEAGDAAKGFDMAKVVSHAVETNNLLNCKSTIISMTKGECSRFGIPAFCEAVDGYMAMMDLAQRRYFRRSWIVQEVVFGVPHATVHCGANAISFSDLARAIFCGLQLEIPLFGDVDQVEAFTSLVKASVAQHGLGHRPSRALKDLLSQHQCCQASLPLDKIFAFLSLADDVSTGKLTGQKIPLRADYKKLTADLYREVTVKMLSHYRDLDILGTPTRKDEKNHWSELSNLPSWVPNWNRSASNKIPFTMRGLYGEEFGHYSAAKSTEAEVEWDVSSKSILGLQGFVFDQIKESSDVFGERILGQCPGDAAQTLSWLAQAERICQARARGTYLATAGHRFDAYIATVTAGGQDYLQSKAEELPGLEPISEPFISQYHHLIASLRLRTFVERLPVSVRKSLCLRVPITFAGSLAVQAPAMCRGEHTALQMSPLFLRRIRTSMQNRRAIRTEKGYIALGPRECGPGDGVALLKGGRVPLVVRRYAGGKTFRVVGEAYVQGVMQGEAFQEADCGLMQFN